jgi:uncharacterized metal-binding protein
MLAGASQLPLVYACSGCSSAAQLANHVALQLDRRGVAEMSCIAGVGGDVPYLLKIAQSGRAMGSRRTGITSCSSTVSESAHTLTLTSNRPKWFSPK